MISKEEADLLEQLTPLVFKNFETPGSKINAVEVIKIL
ncbi:hypothetical protein J2787_001368 [Chryseobacterium rhizosphaerae]|uniref:Uncharacterized protein n=1 Tax=Chryseobacterium rhizosphaerae TaxID=395937 RepID=A0AAE3Y9F8_9FLAO|nr:hypothetical protein [Chryseobacterium rhizosphaerae]